MGEACVPIKLYLQTQVEGQIRPMGSSLPTHELGWVLITKTTKVSEAKHTERLFLLMLHVQYGLVGEGGFAPKSLYPISQHRHLHGGLQCPPQQEREGLRSGEIHITSSLMSWSETHHTARPEFKGVEDCNPKIEEN